jgi:hypothetical protein
MTRFTKLPTQALAIGLFAITGLAAASPMAGFVDCSDSFWRVACSVDADGDDTDTTDIIVGEPVTIDSDAICAEVEGGFIICRT